MDSVKRDYREGFDLHPSFQEGGHLFHPRCTQRGCGGAALPRDVFGVCSSHPEHVPWQGRAAAGGYGASRV